LMCPYHLSVASLVFFAMSTIEVCKSDPNPILSDSFGFRNKNIHFGLIKLFRSRIGSDFDIRSK
jgi:hypothetical protein